MITKFGKRFLTSYVAGTSSLDSKEMALGIATNSEYALADTNSRLGFEFYRVPIRQGGINIDASESPVKYTVIYSATVPTNIAGKIISSAKVQIEYHALRKDTPSVPFLDAPAIVTKIASKK